MADPTTRRSQPDPIRALAEKIRALPPERIVEVADFVDFLCSRHDERELRSGATGLAESSFAAVWDNPDDAEYDQL
jgi:hypothetical protein